MDFFQAPPVLSNTFDGDRVLKNFLKRQLPEKIWREVEKDLRSFGEKAAGSIRLLGEEAESEPPVHTPYSPWGKRIDEVKVSRAWKELDRISAEEGIVAIGYERKQQEFSRLYQFAKLYLFHPSSAIYSCPLAMTDGAARVLEVYGSAEMKKRAYAHLTSRDPKTFWTSGQWMTERTGGSDVSGTSTVARKTQTGYELFGTKWFTSATTSQMAMTLARVEGEATDKLSLFYVELRNSEGELQNIEINRLKEKMGTKALPTAELTLKGTPAALVGEVGKGVKTIATLFNITRIYNACCAVGYMRRGLDLAISYSQKREAFKKHLIEHDLHAETLGNLEVRFEASFYLTFEAARLLGREECGKASAEEAAILRLLIPLAKLYTAKEGVAIASEVIESFGGAGYVEDTGLPSILRNAQVLAIWEGTTNVLSLDAIRAVKKENALGPFLNAVAQRLQSASESKNKEALNHDFLSLQSSLERCLKLPEDEVAGLARNLSLSLSRVFAAALMLEGVQDSLQEISLRKFIRRGLLEDLDLGKKDFEESRRLLTK
jgi:putative acyl-CoA dehydrogenase